MSNVHVVYTPQTASEPSLLTIYDRGYASNCQGREKRKAVYREAFRKANEFGFEKIPEIEELLEVWKSARNRWQNSSNTW